MQITFRRPWGYGKLLPFQEDQIHVSIPAILEDEVGFTLVVRPTSPVYKVYKSLTDDEVIAASVFVDSEEGVVPRPQTTLWNNSKPVQDDEFLVFAYLEDESRSIQQLFTNSWFTPEFILSRDEELFFTSPPPPIVNIVAYGAFTITDLIQGVLTVVPDVVGTFTIIDLVQGNMSVIP
jgi:hypothetical protein